MLRFALQRLLVALTVVIGVSAATWLMFRLLLPEVVDDQRSVLGGLAGFLWDLVRLDLGRAPGLGNRTVLDVLLESLPADLWLLGGAMVIGVVLGLVGGAICGINPRGRTSRVLEGVSLLALCAPVYWVGLVAVLLFSADIGRVPIPILGGQGTYRPLTEDPIAWLHGLLLPWLVLALPIAGACLRMLRLSVQDALDADFTRTALGKGLRWRRVVRRHVVPVGTPPVLTLAGALSATLVSNAVLIEQTFNIPGTLRLMVSAVGVTEGDTLEIAVLRGVVIAGATVVVLCVLVSELLHGWLDPRVRE